MEFRRSDAEKLRSALRMEQILLQRNSHQFTDAEALVDPDVFEGWAPDRPYGEGQIIRHPADQPGEKLYRIVQSGGVTKSQAHQPPDGAGMLAVYRPIERGSAGTVDDPIPYTYGMDCTTAKYYSYNGKTYLCKGDMLPCTWPPGSAGMWQWELVK